ncbi:salicylate hydroxylase [Lentinula raphanica]|nr:salicylate hydroxylase [Lentinula raphanica]
MASSKLRLAIVGGGISGLTLAVALKDCRNIQVDIYEQAHEISEIGAGITLWQRGQEILESLGLKEDLLKVINEEPEELDKQKLAFQYRLSDRADGFNFYNLYSKGGGRYFHRQEIQQLLLKHVPDFVTVHLSHQLKRCEEAQDSVKLIFKDESEATCDILIAGDGIKSVVRNCISNEGPSYTGTDVYRYLIPKENLAKVAPNHSCLEHPSVLCGKSQYIVSYPISHGRFINVAACVTIPENEDKPLPGPEVRKATTKEVVDHFKGWETEVVQLLEKMENPVCYVLRELHPLKTYITRRIALIGDAAHGMTPFLGAGGGQAIEDAYVLGRLFSEASPENWLRVLEAYNLVRLPTANKIQHDSHVQGHYVQLLTPEFENIKGMGQELAPEQMNLLLQVSTKHWSWLDTDEAEQDLTRAIEYLRNTVAA